MLTKRQQKILQQIITQPGIHGKEISDICKVSARTIRTEISNINKEAKCMLIRSNAKTGYGIQQDCMDLAFQLLQQEGSEDEQEDRMYKILGAIFFEEECSLYDLSDLLNLSLSAIKKEVNRTLQFIQQRYDLKVFVVKKEVCSLCVQEKEIRELIFRMIKDSLFNKENRVDRIVRMILVDSYLLEETEVVSQKVQSVLHKFDIQLSDVDFMMLLYGIQICRVRNSFGFGLEKVGNDTEEVIQSMCLSLTYLQSEDVAPLSKLFHTFKMSKNDLQAEISDFTYIIFNEFCKEVFDKYSLDLKESKEMAHNMLIHIEYMNRRVLSGFELSNPLLDELKHKCPFSFEISMMIVPIVFKYKRIYIKEDEISYLSLYVEHFLQNVNKKLRVVVMTGHTHKFKNNLVNWIEQYFPNQIEVVQIISRYSTTVIDYSHVDMIIAMNECIPVEGIETYVFPGLPGIADVPKVDRLIHRIRMHKRVSKLIHEYIPISNVHIISKPISFEDSILEISNVLMEKGCIVNAKEFCEDLVQREVNYPTYLANRVMMPHALFTFATKTSIEVILLKEAITQQEMEVQLLFVLALERKHDANMDVLFHFFHQAANHKTYIDGLLACASKEEFIENLNNLKLLEE
ncbi:MAG: PTS sugar transporter subunit IIA [Bacillota bacterium]|nr:PTS sugar transporter subunit IIA [Bacillota bacterium]